MQYDIHMSSRGGGTATADEGDIIIPVDVDRSPKPKHRKPPVTAGKIGNWHRFVTRKLTLQFDSVESSFSEFHFDLMENLTAIPSKTVATSDNPSEGTRQSISVPSEKRR
ncbi:hypothetical protein ACHAWU_004957 [Discostella pseudostelligera]|uniref:Uncharacterized protein n=1 Tax=Discostella pseudostelligera TaxID=259834 RepID=A0ABD3MR78_9STRA